MLRPGISTEHGTLPLENISALKKEEDREPVKHESGRHAARNRAAEPEERPVEKIIYLYKDKTFREYHPE